MELFVWDFHGVLEKDNDLAVLDISNAVLEQKGHTVRFTAENNQEYYGLKWYQYFERLLPDLSKEDHMALQAACFKFAEENLHVLAKHIKPNDHAKEVLTKINEVGHDQILLSNTRPHDLIWFVETVGLRSVLPNDKVVGVNAHEKHGTKLDALREYLEGKSFDKIVIIGDSESDMALQQAKGGITYFYSHPHIELKKAVKADFIITDLREVLNEI